MQIINFNEITQDFFEFKEFSGIEKVSEIISTVKKNGDKSVIEFSEKFGDGLISNLALSEEEINEACASVS